MDIKTLEHEFEKAEKTEDFSIHNAFVKDLLATSTPEILQFHFRLLIKTESTNQKLYQRLRAAFGKRGESAKPFLIAQTEHESDPKIKGDAIQILGHIRASEVLPVCRICLSDENDYLRYNSIIVLGWMGEPNDVDLLCTRMKVEIEPRLRGYLATALRQIFLRFPETKNACLRCLQNAIGIEQDEFALELIIIGAQTISRQYFGLRESINQGVVTGDIQKAKIKSLSYFESMAWQ